MQTFLIVVAVILASLVVAGAFVVAKLKQLTARAGLYLLKEGIKQVKLDAQADYVSEQTRGQLADLEAEANKVPAPGLFSGKQVILAIAPLLKRLAEIKKDIDAAKPAPADDANVVIIDAEPAKPTLALTDGSNDAKLAAFKAEWVKPGSGIKDAWVEFKNGENWLVYQLDAEQITDKLPGVPAEYDGLTTIITWFPRNEA
jgi:hypothetical protein